MKKIILSLAAMFFSAMSFAQSSTLATLSHEGEVTTFYGIDALKEAVAACAHGDVINLSSGVFNATDIYKAITLRGAGSYFDSESGTETTEIRGDFFIYEGDSINNFTFEGIRFLGRIKPTNKIVKPQFIKCRLAYMPNNGANRLNDATFLHCVILGFYSSFYGTATFINSIIYDLSIYSEVENSAECINCRIYGPIGRINNSVLRNCVILNGASTSSSAASYNSSLSSSCRAYNCVGSTGSTFGNSVFGYCGGANNKHASPTELYGSGYNLSSITMKLTEDAAKKYLGSDETVVGIHGGSLPYDSRTSNPRITKLNVARKTTADGKLSVDIEVKSADF